jgi:hypothetical protein
MKITFKKERMGERKKKKLTKDCLIRTESEPMLSLLASQKYKTSRYIVREIFNGLCNT